MRKILSMAGIISVFTLISLSSRGQDYKMALGVRLSNATPRLNNSVTFKYFIDEGHAIEGLFTFSNPVAIGGIYEIHRPMNVQGLKWFFGPGAYVAFNDNNVYAGVTGIIGLDYKFANVPLNLSADWKPELNLINGINFEAAAVGLSVRFTFGGGKNLSN
jgi:hypothetical protein